MEKIKVMFSSLFSFSIISSRFSVDFESRLAVGSSAKINFGFDVLPNRLNLQKNKSSRGQIVEIGDFVAAKQSVGRNKINCAWVFEIGPRNAVDIAALTDWVGPAISYDQPCELGQIVPVGDGRAGFDEAVGQEVKSGFAIVPAPGI